MYIRIKLGETTYFIQCDPTEKVLEVKQKLHNLLDQPVDNQRLIFIETGEVLDDSKTLADLKVENDAVVALTLGKERIERNQQQQTPPLQTPPQQIPQPYIPNVVPNYTQNYKQSPPIYQGSNIQFDDCDDEKENVLETLQYPLELIMSHPLSGNQNQPQPPPARSNRWSVREDEALIACYMEHCTDAMVGTNQKASVLWRKIIDSYGAAQASRPNELPSRTIKMLENRWRRMATDVLLWVSVYEEASKITRSGSNDMNVYQNAYKLFRNSTNPPRNFLCEHAWKMIVEYPNWRRRIRWGMSKKEREEAQVKGTIENSSGSGKRVRVDDNGDTIIGSDSYVSGGIPRPDDVKKSKAAKRRDKRVELDEAVVVIDEQMTIDNQLKISDRNYKDMKLELLRLKNIRKQQQMELEKKHIELEKEKINISMEKMKYDMLQTLMSRSLLTLGEEKLKKKLLMEVCDDS